ncbi:hypothetical protein ACFO1B_45830 [Dactylosporangium siamense]|uniref:Uncharacterized protein n=1 Tax=Dactylosporangium siamense TaxID=685454 RepID=A0A919UBM3_9ACTN|nr:hypothetical protein [Dactylosporangium siamense]GIG45791.1 hypothetical protein Dsi01nite_038320 [Dactylosporangium siamense]
MSSHDAYGEPERGRTFTVVLLALLILTVIGALFGFVLGRRSDGDTTSGAGNAQSPGPSTAVTTQGAPTAAASAAATPCPQFIGDAAKKRDPKAALPLTLKLFVRTDNREAWICLEADGQGLWYQGHDKKKSFYNNGAGETPEDGVNGLLLSTVTSSLKDGNEIFIATINNSTITVARDKFAVSGGQNYAEDVRESLPKK